MNWVISNLDVIAQHAVSHVFLAVPAIVASLLLAVPIAWLATRVKGLRAVVVSGSSLLYAIPSLPLFIVLPLILGTGLRDPINVVVALTVYGLALMVPITVDALRQVEPSVIDAATALGYGRARRFFTVELPLAGPTMLAGLRVVSVSTIALVTVSAVLGMPNLGMLFTDGFQRNLTASVLTGLVLTVALALLLDAILALLGRVVLPWGRRA